MHTQVIISSSDKKEVINEGTFALKIHHRCNVSTWPLFLNATALLQPQKKTQMKILTSTIL